MPKRGCLGCSFPVVILVVVIIIVLTVLSFLAGPLGKSLFGDVGLPAWMSVPPPHPELPAETIFHIFGFPIANSVIATWFSMIVLLALFFAATRKMKLVPRGIQNLMEFAVNALLDFCISVAGEKNGRRFFPVIATIFLFVLMNAWLSLLPGFGSIIVNLGHGHTAHLLRGANTDVNTPLAIALASFVAVEYFGIRTLGLFTYLGKFIRFSALFKGIGQVFKGKLKDGLMGLFLGVIDVFVGCLEALSEVVRIVSFTFRLFGNMTAGEILLLIAAFLVPWIVALPFYGLELLVGFIQALIFGGLTLVFLTLATSHHE
ncbi:F0F1 ATP synthase subunit A [Chloroflexota bacterium]